MPKFLTQDEIYRLLQRELPPNVYPDGAPSAFWSTAENDSVAKALASVYARLERVFANLFPQSTDEQLNDWEVKVFGKVVSGSLLLQERRDRILGKIRALPTISLWDVLVLVNSYVPDGVYTGVYELGTVGNNSPSFGYWSIGESLLGVNTILGGINVGLVTGPSACEVYGPNWPVAFTDGTYVDPSLTPVLFQQIRDQQYGYQVKIYGYTIPADLLADLDLLLTAAEPARSTHTIIQNASLAGDNLIYDRNNVDRFTLVNCVARASSSPSGYVGKVLTP